MPHRSMVLFARPDWFVRKWWKLAIDTEVNSPVSFSTQKVKTQTFLVFKKTETRAKTMFQFADKIHQIFWFLYGKCIPVDDDSTKWRCEVMQFTSSLRDEINVYHCSPFAKTRPEPDVTWAAMTWEVVLVFSRNSL